MRANLQQRNTIDKTVISCLTGFNYYATMTRADDNGHVFLKANC